MGKRGEMERRQNGVSGVRERDYRDGGSRMSGEQEGSRQGDVQHNKGRDRRKEKIEKVVTGKRRWRRTGKSGAWKTVKAAGKDWRDRAEELWTMKGTHGYPDRPIDVKICCEQPSILAPTQALIVGAGAFLGGVGCLSDKIPAAQTGIYCQSYQ